MVRSKSVFSLLVVVLFCLVCQKASASHIVGGNFTLTHQSGDRYLLELDLFLDCINGNKNAFIDSPFVGIYKKATNAFVESVQLFYQESASGKLKIGDTKCADKVDYCLFQEHYEATISMPASKYGDPDGYYLSWERCCRNSTIVNIKNPEAEGVVIYLEIPPSTFQNSTPIFKNLPVNLLCVGSPFTFDFKVEDLDGDLLKFSLVEPLAGFTDQDNTNAPGDPNHPRLNKGPYPKTQWNDGFGLNNIMDGNPSLTIDPNTGVVNVTPMRIGFFVAAVRCEEFRNGQKIGEVVRELQYTVSNCSENTFPSIENVNDGDTISLYPNSQFTLKLEGNDIDDDSVFVEIESDVFDELVTGLPAATFLNTEQLSYASSEISWNPQCDQIGLGPIAVKVTFSDNGCPLPKSNEYTFWLKVVDIPQQPAPYYCLTHKDGKVRIGLEHRADPKFISHYLIQRSQPGTDWDSVYTVNSLDEDEWLDDDTEGRLDETFCYRIIIIDYCGGTDDTSRVACSPDDVSTTPDISDIQNISVVGDGVIEILWEKAMGDDFKNYELFREEENVVTSVSSFNHRDTVSWKDSNLQVNQTIYGYSLHLIDQCNEVGESATKHSVLLSGESVPGSHELKWSPFDVWTAEDQKVEIEFLPTQEISFLGVAENAEDFVHEPYDKRPGKWQYRVLQEKDGLISYSNAVLLSQKPVVWIPNAFTPNDDEINDVWNVMSDYVLEFHLEIYNRWGQCIFETDDATEKWTGENAPSGVYVYRLYYQGENKKFEYLKGNVTLIR